MRKLVSILICCVAISSCSLNDAKNIKDCTFAIGSVHDFKAGDISLDGKKSLRDFSPSDMAVISRGLTSNMPLEFTANIEIKNPNKKNAELSALEWILLIKDVEIANGILEEKVKIPSNKAVNVPILVQTNTNVLKQFSFNEIKNIIFYISGSRRLPQNAKIKVKPVLKVGNKFIKAPLFYTIDLNK